MIPGALTTKLGPLPAWAWGLLLGVGVLGYAYLHRSSASASDGADAGAGDTTGTAADTQDLSSLDSTAPLSFAGPSSGIGGGTESFQPPPPLSLRIDPQQWARLQKELAAIRKGEHKAPKRGRKGGRPVPVRQQPHGPQRPRTTQSMANSGSQGMAA